MIASECRRLDGGTGATPRARALRGRRADFGYEYVCGNGAAGGRGGRRRPKDGSVSEPDAGGGTRHSLPGGGNDNRRNTRGRETGESESGARGSGVLVGRVSGAERAASGIGVRDPAGVGVQSRAARAAPGLEVAAGIRGPRKKPLMPQRPLLPHFSS